MVDFDRLAKIVAIFCIGGALALCVGMGAYVLLFGVHILSPEKFAMYCGGQL